LNRTVPRTREPDFAHASATKFLELSIAPAEQIGRSGLLDYRGGQQVGRHVSLALDGPFIGVGETGLWAGHRRRRLIDGLGFVRASVGVRGWAGRSRGRRRLKIQRLGGLKLAQLGVGGSGFELRICHDG